MIFVAKLNEGLFYFIFFKDCVISSFENFHIKQLFLSEKQINTFKNIL